MSPITTHILDTASGSPADGVPVTLEHQGADGWSALAQGTTDDDGRVRDLLPAGSLASGVYRITFDIDAYFQRRSIRGFYPHATIVFRVDNPDQHYHVPLLLSPFGYSTYRGS
jgi:5-hydroxyisourate hydrolase